SMIRKKPVPDLILGGSRFFEKIMLDLEGKCSWTRPRSRSMVIRISSGPRRLTRRRHVHIRPRIAPTRHISGRLLYGADLLELFRMRLAVTTLSVCATARALGCVS